MTLIAVHEAKRMIESGEARIASAFRHWSTGGLYVILDLGKGAQYTVLDRPWESLFRKTGLLKEEA